MQLWRGAEFAIGVAGEPNADGNTGREHHGQRADGKHHAVWHVLVDGESRRRCCDRGGIGRIDSNAVYSRNSRAVGAGRADGFDRQHAGAR